MRDKCVINYKLTDSIVFKTWLGFILLTAMILGFLWASEVLFFKIAYQRMKTTQLQKVSDEIIENYQDVYGYPTKSYGDYLAEASTFNNMLVIIINPGIGKAFVVSGGISNEDTDTLDEIEDGFYDYINAGQTRFSYTLNVKGGSFKAVFGGQKEYGGQTVYFYMASVVPPSDSAMTILANQLLIVTILCMLVAVVLAWFISRKIALPICEFSGAVKKLGKGDYSVRLKKGNGIEFDQLADTLNYTATELGKTENLRREFLANVGHDLRTPLTMIKAYAEMIRDISGGNKVKRDEHCKIISDEVDRLNLLVGDILELSKLQSGAATLELKKVNLSELAQTVIGRFSYLSERDGYVFETDITPSLNVFCDAKKIEQVIYNLIGNAVNYTGADKKVKISVKKEGDKVFFRVADSGQGISQEDLKYVWERYYRSGRTQRSVVGSGLGLSIVKGVLSSHNADYGVESNIGSGSVFWFALLYKE